MAFQLCDIFIMEIFSKSFQIILNTYYQSFMLCPAFLKYNMGIKYSCVNCEYLIKNCIIKIRLVVCFRMLESLARQSAINY